MKVSYSIILLVCFSIPAYSQSSIKPNVVIIFMDDMGYGDTEPYGMTGIHTPNFNRMAAEGLRFTNFYAAQPICTASRAALLTGTYPNRIGLFGALGPEVKIALNPEEQTIASMLKDNGYKTAMLGKWHLGSKAPYFPTHYGFDSFYGIPYSHDYWPVNYDGMPITDPTNARGQWPPLPVIDGDRTIATINDLEQQSNWTKTLTEKATAFINQNKKTPFFLYLAHPLPHVPLVTSTAFKGKSNAGVFGDVIMELDWSVGEILKALDRNKLSSNTIVIIMSDNGPWVHFGNNAGSSGALREGKGTIFEGGTRVPCMMRWPGKIPAGNVTGELMTTMDILPTIAEVTGSKLKGKKIDGISFQSFIKNTGTAGPRDVFYYYYNENSLKAVRYKNWKLVLPHTTNSYEAGTLNKDGFPGTIGQAEIKLALYDLQHDPGENYDVQNLYPDIVKQLQKLADDARNDLGDDLTQSKGSNRREPARLN